MTRTLQIACALVGGALAGGFAIVHALDGNIEAMIWAGAAAVLAFIVAIHRCPAPALPERGEITIGFTGGPHDGGWTALPEDGMPELLGQEIRAEGATYTITSVDHTCYTAEVSL